MTDVAIDEPFRLRMLTESITRPYPVRLPMVLAGRTRQAPAFAAATLALVGLGLAGFWGDTRLG
jgi:hypothetical protein